LKSTTASAKAVALTVAYSIKHFGSDSFPGFVHKVLKEVMSSGASEVQQCLGNAMSWTQNQVDEANTTLCQYVVAGCKSQELQTKVLKRAELFSNSNI